jgi:GrpB-like predicted nucleotidyltransferase (UPF0157 family)
MVSGVPERSVDVIAHDPDWSSQAAALIAGLRTALGGDAVRVEHIGSTAIPAMDAKAVLDLQVSVLDLDHAQAEFDEPLRVLGFGRSPYQQDHVPAGRDDDPGRWTKRLWLRRSPEPPDVNLHVRVVGSANERLALLFRDWMRTHPEAVAAYSGFKHALADAVPDLDAYSDIKDPVVDVVIVAAEEWAARTGWTVDAAQPSRPAMRRTE